MARLIATYVVRRPQFMDTLELSSPTGTVVKSHDVPDMAIAMNLADQAGAEWGPPRRAIVASTPPRRLVYQSSRTNVSRQAEAAQHAQRRMWGE